MKIAWQRAVKKYLCFLSFHILFELLAPHVFSSASIQLILVENSALATGLGLGTCFLSMEPYLVCFLNGYNHLSLLLSSMIGLLFAPFSSLFLRVMVLFLWNKIPLGHIWSNLFSHSLIASISSKPINLPTRGHVPAVSLDQLYVCSV